MKKQDQHHKKQNSEPTEERELISEFGKYDGDQPIPQPKDYDEIEY